MSEIKTEVIPMARPIRCRRICMEPDFDSFSPDLRQPVNVNQKVSHLLTNF